MHNPRTVDVSLSVLTSLVRKHDLGEPHPVLAGARRYVSPRLAHEAERRARAELAGAGLDTDDALRDFTDLLTLVQRARTEYFGWMSNGERRYAVLTAALGRRAVAVTRTGDRVRFERIAANEVLEELVNRLPDVLCAEGVPLSVSALELEQNRQRDRPIMRRPTTVTRDSTQRMAALLREPRFGGAKLYAAGRDDTGTRHRSETWLTLLDTISGRWLIYPSKRLGDRVINAAPGAPQTIAARLNELRRSVP